LKLHIGLLSGATVVANWGPSSEKILQDPPLEDWDTNTGRISERGVQFTGAQILIRSDFYDQSTSNTRKANRRRKFNRSRRFLKRKMLGLWMLQSSARIDVILPLRQSGERAITMRSGFSVTH
jgi:hypothetical protein